MASNTPSTEAWRALYKSAGEFKSLAPWQWMDDTQLFGVRDPASGEVGYCCVLGAGCSVYGLVVYLGALGLKNYLLSQQGPPEGMYPESCLTAFFEDREDLMTQDREVIRQLGLKFRGRAAWPCFRSAHLGYLPWLVSPSEASYLATALEQALFVAKALLETPDLLGAARAKQGYVRERGPDGHWRAVWAQYPPPPPKPPHALADPLRVERLRKDMALFAGSWEVHLASLPVTLTDAERPYYPRMLLCVDHQSGFVFHSDIVPSYEGQAKLQDRFLEMLETAQMRPREVRLKSPDLKEVLEPLAARLGIVVRRVKRLPALEEALAALEGAFGTGQI